MAAETAEADLISLAMGRFDERCPTANGRVATERRRGIKSTGQKRQLPRIVLHLLPHLSLVLINAFFVAFVALIMHSVEVQNELEGQMQMVANIERISAEFIMHFRNKPIILGGDLEAESRAFAEKMLRMGWTRGREGIPLPTLGRHNGNNFTTPPSSVWTLPNSLLFATSLISRIGYGHIVPRTSEGKFLCQLFALIGCPLFLLLVADIGKTIAFSFQFPFRWIAAMRAEKCRKRRPTKNPISNGENRAKCAEEGQQPKESDDSENGRLFGTTAGERMAALIALPTFAIFCVSTSLAYSYLEGWHLTDCFYFSFVSFFAIGYGDFAPSNCVSVLFTVCSLLLGMALATLLIDFVGVEYVRNFHRIERTAIGKCCGRERKECSRGRTSRSRKK